MRLIRPTIITLVALSTPLLVMAQDTFLKPPFGSPESQTQPVVIIAVLIQALLGLTGACALLIFVWGGLHMIFSGGNEEKVTKGRQAVMWAAIGLLVVLSSYGALSFLFNIFQTASGG